MSPEKTQMTIRQLASSAFRFDPFTLPLTETIEIACIWGEDERFEWSVNGSRVLTVESDLMPSVVKVYQICGGGIISLKVE